MFDNVLTLISATDDAALTHAVAEGVENLLCELGAEVKAPDWLAPEKACDLFFSGATIDAAANLVRESGRFSDARIDFIVQEARDRRKRLIVADLESTLIENEMLDELADFLGVRSRVSQITRRAMNGEIDFVTALKARVGLLKNLPVSALHEAAARIRLMPGANVFIATSKAHGAYIALISGGFTFFAEYVQTFLQFDVVVANELLVKEGKLTGEVREPILTREGKRTALLGLAAQRDVPLNLTLALGDGANDLPMLEAAGLGIAFHAKPSVAERARNHVSHGDLTSLLYAQGYRMTEFKQP